MAVRESFQLHAELRFERDNPAVEAIVFVLEDELGKGVVRRWNDDESGETRVRVACEAQPMDARRGNWLIEQLRTLAKYLRAPADVQCADAVDGDRSFRLEAGRTEPEGTAAEPRPEEAG